MGETENTLKIYKKNIKSRRLCNVKLQKIITPLNSFTQTEWSHLVNTWRYNDGSRLWSGYSQYIWELLARNSALYAELEHDRDKHVWLMYMTN